MKAEEDISQSPKSKSICQVPANILSPPTSRSNSPVDNMTFPKEVKENDFTDKELCHNPENIGQNQDQNAGDQKEFDNDLESLKFDSADLKKQKEQEENEKKSRDEVSL